MQFDDFELDVVTAPAAEPLTRDEAKLWLKLTQALQDSEVDSLLRECREAGEKHTGRTWLTSVLKLRLPEWPSDDEIEFPRPPFISVASVKYYDPDGVLQTLSPSSYFVTASKGNGKLSLKASAEWPDLEDEGRPYPIEVEFSAGYGVAGSSLPGPYLSGFKLLLTHLFKNRSQEETGTNVAPRVYGLEELWAFDRVIPAS